jgi:sorbitol-specific phosphotransferase system component IIBC
MAMYLAGIPTTTIQLIGRWKSNALMRYIREQVDCFTENVSSKMLTVKNFYTIPNTSTDQSLYNTTATKEDGPNLSKVFKALVL